MKRSLRSYLGADFSAKVRWRIRFERNPLFVTLQDKFAVRAYAEARGVATAGLLHVTDRPETLLTADLPQNCMIKATHGCGWNILRRDGRYIRFGDGRLVSAAAVDENSPNSRNPEPAPAETLTQADVVETCRAWLSRRYSRREWAYHQIQPRIIVEELLQPASGPELIDYRFYTFDGVVRAINVGSPSYRRNHQNVFLAPDWQPIELSRYDEQMPDPLPTAPSIFPEMLDAAARLGAGVSFVRVDLYHTTKGIVLGEMTVYPEGGRRGSPTGCPRFNRWLGRQWSMTTAQTVGVAAWNGVGPFSDASAFIHHRWNGRG